LQTAADSDVVPVQELNRISAQVRALAAVHDILTKQARESGEATDVSTREVLEKLVSLLNSSAPNRRILLKSDDTRIAGRKATSLVIVANELITNALKHGQGDIQVIFTHREGRGFLDVLDEGPGFPPDFNPLG